MATRKTTKNSTPTLFALTVLFIITLLSQLASPIYSALAAGENFLVLLLPSFIFISVLTLPSLWFGAKLSPVPNLNFKPTTQHFNFVVFNSLLLGFFLLFLRYLLQPYLPNEIPNLGFRGPIAGVLVSIGAAIGEEVWFRYGLLSVCFYLYLKLSKKAQLDSFSALTLITFIALLFGFAHLPQLSSFGADTAFAILATVLGNVVVGIWYGWCYWKYGLIAAMIAHFSLDIVLHVMPALM